VRTDSELLPPEQDTCLGVLSTAQSGSSERLAPQVIHTPVCAWRVGPIPASGDSCPSIETISDMAPPA
jgi:hypothetical protein